MARATQILLAAIALVLVSAHSSRAFTPDAAFKMKTLVGQSSFMETNNSSNKRGIVVVPPSPSSQQGPSSRNVQLSLIGQENVRKSITVPPAYEDYMAVRQHALVRLLQRND